MEGWERKRIERGERESWEREDGRKKEKETS